MQNFLSKERQQNTKKPWSKLEKAIKLKKLAAYAKWYAETHKIKKMNLKPIITEKAVMMIEAQNILTFKTDKSRTKEQIKKEIEDLFKVKIEKVRTLIKGNQKYAYVKLKKDFPAIDLATKLGLM